MGIQCSFRILRAEDYPFQCIPIFQEMPSLIGVDAWVCLKHNKAVNVCKSFMCEYWGTCQKHTLTPVGAV